jgi:putative ubiquitin-RnfH superfamily antitoxin RatB of RatAB toxin-antitoxin module
MPDKMSIEVVYAAEREQILVPVTLGRGATVQDALDASGLVARFPGHRLNASPCGVWGEVVERTRPLREGDRVEFYRPLHMDPREARRRLAESGRTMGRSAET